MSLDLFNRATQAWKVLPDEQIADAIGSGQFAPEKGSRIPVVLPDGTVGTVDSSEAQRAFARGAVYDTEEMRAARARKREFGGRGLEAAGLGALSGLTLGLGPEFLKATGLVTPRVMGGLEEENTGAYRGAEVLSTLAPILATGGAGALAKGGATAAKLGAEAAVKAGAKEGAELLAKEVAPGLVRQGLALTPPALVARAGRAVERTTAAILGEAAKRHVVGQIVPKLAGGALEAGVYGGAQVLDESALGDTDLTAEQWWAGVEKGMVFGLGAVGVLGGASALVENALRPALASVIKRIPPSEFFSGLKRRFMFKSAFGQQVAAEKGLTKKPWRRLIAEDAMADEAAAERGGLAEGVIQEADEFARGAIRTNRAEAAKDYLEDVLASRVGRFATQEEWADAIGTRLGQVSTELKGVPSTLDAAARMPTVDPQGVVRRLLDRAKKLDKIAGARVEATALRREAETIEDAIRGPRPAQPDIHGGTPPSAPYRAAEGAIATIPGVVIAGEPVRAPWRRLSFAEALEQRQRVQPNEAAYMKGMAPEVSDSLAAKKYAASTWNALMDEAAEPLFAGLKKPAGYWKDLRQEVSLLLDMNKYAQARLMQHRANNLVPITAYMTGGTGGIVGAIGGGMLGGVPGVALGAALGVGARMIGRDRGDMILATAADKIAKLRVISAKATETAKRTQGAVDRFMESARHAAVPFSVKVLSESTFDGPKIKGKDKEAAYRQRTQEVRQLAANQQQLIERVARGMSHINDAAPKLSAAVQARAIPQVLYLADRIPRDPYSDTRLLAHLKPPRTSEGARSSWLREYAAFHDPVSVYENLADGIFNREGWNLNERFYPRLNDDFRLKLTDSLAAMTEPPDYRLRLRLEQIGIHVEPSARPEVVAAVQATYVPPVEPVTGDRAPRGRSAQGEAARTHADRIAVG